MTEQACRHSQCHFILASAQVECYCGHTKEQHRRGGRHKCDGSGASASRLVPTKWGLVPTKWGACPCLAYYPPRGASVRTRAARS